MSSTIYKRYFKSNILRCKFLQRIFNKSTLFSIFKDFKAIMPIKLYRSLIQEVTEWMTIARQARPPVVSKLLQSLDMSAPPPIGPKSQEQKQVDDLELVHKQLRGAISEQFRALNGVSTDNVKDKMRDANEILMYLRSQRTYKTLLDRYNPTATLEDHERIRLTARRVGLELPKDIEQRIEKEENKTEQEDSADSKDSK
ncbi:hypothetical protein V1511DRAFT_498400 [Dipodascopsis uninucleata]